MNANLLFGLILLATMGAHAAVWSNKVSCEIQKYFVDADAQTRGEFGNNRIWERDYPFASYKFDLTLSPTAANEYGGEKEIILENGGVVTISAKVSKSTGTPYNHYFEFTVKSQSRGWSNSSSPVTLGSGTKPVGQRVLSKELVESLAAFSHQLPDDVGFTQRLFIDALKQGVIKDMQYVASVITCYPPNKVKTTFQHFRQSPADAVLGQGTVKEVGGDR